MAGKRLLDVAALLGASRSVAQKHVALRTHQLDVYCRTSSLAKGLKIQTDRVTTLTANAAKDISERSSQAFGQRQGQSQSPAAGIPSSESTEGRPYKPDPVKEGLEQDHHYDWSEANTVVDGVPESDLNVRQEKADRNPLPDGTIPPAGSPINIPKQDQDVYSDIPSTEPPKAPLSKEDATAKGDELKPNSSLASTIPKPSYQAHQLSSEEARKLQRQAESQIPSITADPQAATPNDSEISSLSRGHDEDVFYIRSIRSSPVLSGLPRLKIPKQTESKQEAGIAAKDGINADVFYSPEGHQHQESSIAKHTMAAAQAEVPEDIDMAIFHSPHVAKMLGGKVHGTKKNRDLREKSAKDHSISESKPTERKNQESPITWRKSDSDVEKLAADIAKDAASVGIPKKVTAQASQSVGYQMHESRVPSSRLGRLWHYGGLATGMAFGAVGESLRRATGNSEGGSLILSSGNMERLVAKLSRMRGAALKLGQMISFQDSKMLPAPIQEVLQRVQDSADYMPASQRDQVLANNLGKDWRDLFNSFEEVPMAAASIGQVHGAVLKSTGQRVAVKIQYPGVADSIDSDLNNLSLLLTASRLLPKGLYLDKTIANARTELGWECDYTREAECGRRFRDLLKDQDVFVVPEIFAKASGKQVLTMERMEGVAVTKVMNFDQEQKDWVGSQILRLCLREITEFKYMQTDPNWTNFLYNGNTQKLELLDFGASREYPDEFIDLYTRVLSAAAKGDRDACRTLSVKLGYLTGYESEVMLNAHVSSILTLAEPFRDSSPDIYDFKDQTITERVTALIPVMMRERLAPPPEETYSLHRKLSGAFLLCARLGSKVRCREMFAQAMEKAGIQEKRGISKG